MPEEAAVRRLVEEGFLDLGEAGLSTTRRWQAALARAALTLQRAGAPWDLRLPIAMALADQDPALTDREVAELVEAMVPVQAAELQRLVASGAPTRQPGEAELMT
jgi:hypothetical protein